MMCLCTPEKRTPWCDNCKNEVFGGKVKPENHDPVFPSPAAGPWIKVSERLPEDEDVVLLYLKSGNVIQGIWYIDGYDKNGLNEEVTHWAEILPPAEEK